MKFVFSSAVHGCFPLRANQMPTGVPNRLAEENRIGQRGLELLIEAILKAAQSKPRSTGQTANPPSHRAP